MRFFFHYDHENLRKIIVIIKEETVLMLFVWFIDETTRSINTNQKIRCRRRPKQQTEGLTTSQQTQIRTRYTVFTCWRGFHDHITHAGRGFPDPLHAHGNTSVRYSVIRYKNICAHAHTRGSLSFILKAHEVSAHKRTAAFMSNTSHSATMLPGDSRRGDVAVSAPMDHLWLD